MAYRLKFSGRAVREIGEAHDWYEERSPGLGSEFQLAFELQLKRVEQVPLMFPELLPGIRRTLLQATNSFSALRSQPLRAAQLKATELKRQPSAQRQRGH